MSTEIVAKSEELRRLIVLVAGASAQVDSLVVKADEGLAADCTCNGETSPVKEFVAQYATTKAADLDALDKTLESKTFLVGQSLSLADLAAFAAVAESLVGRDGWSLLMGAALSHDSITKTLPLTFKQAKESAAYVNLRRWYDHIHHVVPGADAFPLIELALPAFVPPAPVAAPVAAKKEAGNKEAAKKEAAPAKDGKKAEKAEAVPEDKPAEKPKKEKKEKKEKKAEAAPSGGSDEPTVDFLDLRVGKILAVERHPNAESLYVETIDLGEDKPRQIVSGLVKFVPEDKMLNRMVVVVTNLKPAKMRDVMSYGMVLCASNDAHDSVDPVLVPEGVLPGEKISFEGYAREPEAQLNPRKKQFEKIAPHLIVSAEGVCTYKGVPFMTSQGPITATIPGAHIA
ncbi:hypothetical protein QBZ16_005150 [Prototheca wickerhamii]|uniref:Uncharacterized protein n=1 Tax=Prototheca wickerhamii TaxID=3111 RepID=A0AAD9MHJ4_PROWI|nr:hypothetical protein QBZ16_005150 [Prototheca wickerhamii]